MSDALRLDVWAKVEDGSGTWSANKVRKLEYLLGEARAAGRERVVAYGVGSSDWCAATALYGVRTGFDVDVALGGRIPQELRDAYSSERVRLVSMPGHASLPVALAIARLRAGRGAMLLPAGGSGGTGDLGSSVAGAEIAAAVAAGELPAPRTVFVACGTGGTAAGLTAGMAAAGLRAKLTAARVTPRPLGTERLVRRRLDDLCRALGIEEDLGDRLEVVDDFHRPGYAKPSHASRVATALAAQDGLALDATYGAKAFAALMAAARAEAHGPLLFVSTSPIGLSGRS